MPDPHLPPRRAAWPSLLANALLLFGLAWPAAHAAPAPDTLAQRVAACTACHTLKERSDAFFPRIAGKPAGYLYNQLVNFREGRRHYPMMTYMVDHLPDAYLHEIAEYFSQQHPPYAQVLGGSAGSASAAMLQRGKTLATLGDPALRIPACVACHGAQLAGVAPAVPGLAGLPGDYINAQFGAWKNQVRRARAPDCMATIAARLTDADVAALSSWLSTQIPAPDTRPAASFAAAGMRLPLPLECGSVPAAPTPGSP